MTEISCGAKCIFSLKGECVAKRIPMSGGYPPRCIIPTIQDNVALETGVVKHTYSPLMAADCIEILIFRMSILIAGVSAPHPPDKRGHISDCVYRELNEKNQCGQHKYKSAPYNNIYECLTQHTNIVTKPTDCIRSCVSARSSGNLDIIKIEDGFFKRHEKDPRRFRDRKRDRGKRG